MSAQDPLAPLSPVLRALVRAAAPPASQDPAVADWIQKAANWSPAALEALNAHLVPRTFVVGNALTAADVALYGALHPLVAQPAHPAVTRYFDHIQTRPQVRAAADAAVPPLPLVVFDLDSAPKTPREAKKEKAKPPTKAADEAKPPPTKAVDEAKNTADNAKPQRAPKEKKDAAPVAEKKGSGRAPAPAPEPTTPIPSMIDLRVGRIVDVQKHPDADGLYVEQIDVGEPEGPRTVVSGLVNYVPIEQMRGRRLVVVCNLKPASMRGVKSFAMVLCATAKEGREGGIEIVDPPADAPPGERVYFEGAFEHDAPLAQLNPKKKIFETVQPGLVTLATREAAWVDPVSGAVHRMRTKGGVCVAPTFVGASLS